MDGLTLLKTRRSIRKFTEEAVSDEIIEKLTEYASYAASWKNSQPARYYVLRDEEKLDELAKTCTMNFAWNEKLVRQAKVLIIQTIVSKRSGYERDGSPSTSKGSHFESFDAGLSAANFTLAAHEMGLATCILGIFDEENIKELLKLPEGEAVSALILLGYPAEEAVMPKRKPVSELLKKIES